MITAQNIVEFINKSMTKRPKIITPSEKDVIFSIENDYVRVFINESEITVKVMLFGFASRTYTFKDNDAKTIIDTINKYRRNLYEERFLNIIKK